MPQKDAIEVIRKKDKTVRYYLCPLCDQRVRRITHHHIIPKSKGGKGLKGNTVTLCKRCEKILHKAEILGYVVLPSKLLERLVQVR